MGPETRRKIEETVIDILKRADMEHITEFKVRVMAGEQLGVDLSDTEHRRFIRNVVESFLLRDNDNVRDGKEAETKAREGTKELVGEEQETKPMKEAIGDGEFFICKLSNKRNVIIQDFKGKSLVSIRDYYQRDGKQLPSARGISLTTEQWSIFKKSIPAIEEAILKMQLKLRSEVDGLQTECVCNSASDLNPPEFVPMEINRFDGKNYSCWALQMESLLKQLKVTYVLSHPCPNVNLGPEGSIAEIGQARTAKQKWVHDDYICRHNILSSLSDPLYYEYSKKCSNAKELWDELKSVYLYEEVGTKRSQVKKYMEFQVVEERPIVGQVQELNEIADSLVARGMLIDENFHVSAIISKLPPSWKDFCLKLMCEEHLPFWKLMDHMRIEEECRNQRKQGNPPNFHLDKNPGPRTRDIKKHGMCWKRKESEQDSKAPVCYTCGKKGHFS